MKIPPIGFTLGHPLPSYKRALALQRTKYALVALFLILGFLVVVYLDGQSGLIG